jgi:hypothetical protein
MPNQNSDRHHTQGEQSNASALVTLRYSFDELIQRGVIVVQHIRSQRKVMIKKEKHGSKKHK